MKKSAMTFVLILIFFGISCARRDVNLLTFLAGAEHETRVYIYKNGTIVQVSNLSSRLAEMKIFEQIINKKGREWEKSMVSYAPFIKICGTSWTITIQQERIS